LHDVTPALHNGAIARKIRIDNELSAEDVAGLIGVTTRQLSAFEAGTQNMPLERLELLTLKIERRGPQGSLVTVLSEDGVTPLDVVSERNFAGYSMSGDGMATIKSLAIDRKTGRPMMHSTTFTVALNEHVINACIKWERELHVGLRSEFDREPDAADVAMAEWFVKQVRQAEQANPALREWKDRIAAATQARDLAASSDERRAHQEEIDAAIAALNRAMRHG